MIPLFLHVIGCIQQFLIEMCSHVISRSPPKLEVNFMVEIFTGYGHQLKVMGESSITIFVTKQVVFAIPTVHVSNKLS